MEERLWSFMISITTLIENKLGEHLSLKNEHGLSFYIEADGKKLLFDTGSTKAFIDNAEKLKIDLSQLDYVVLSHGHYDHTGGIKPLIETYHNKFVLLVHPDLLVDKFRKDHISKEFLGNDFDAKYLSTAQIRVEFVSEELKKLSENIYLISQFERECPHETNNPAYQVKVDREERIDDFHDEVTMVVDTPKGLVILLGCSHPGVQNIINKVHRLIPKKIYAVIGGTHLVVASKEKIDETITYFKEMKIEYVGVSHCTGELAVKAFQEAFGEKYFYNCTGTTIEMN